MGLQGKGEGERWLELLEEKTRMGVGGRESVRALALGRKRREGETTRGSSRKGEGKR